MKSALQIKCIIIIIIINITHLRAVWLQRLGQRQLVALVTSSQAVTQEGEGVSHVVIHCMTGSSVGSGQEGFS